MSRAFSTGFKKLIQLIGRVTLDDVREHNVNGAEWAAAITKVVNTIEDSRTDVASYNIQGAKAHKSTKDPKETNDVITLGFYSAGGTRVGSAHALENGTYAFKESRAGR